MTFDPISYSVAKRTKRAVVPSSSEIAEKYQIWFDLNCEKPRIYNPNKAEWGYMKYKLGYYYFDNNDGDVWSNYINIPISIAPSESIQYKIEINGDSINVYSNDGTTVLVSGSGASDFWRKVQVYGKDIRVFDETYEQNYFWIEEFDYNNQKAIIWVKLNAGQTQLNIAYGNSDCGVSIYCNGDMTFEFFDDFTSISNIIAVSGDLNVKIVDNTWLDVKGDGSAANLRKITTPFQTPDSFIVESKVKLINPNEWFGFIVVDKSMNGYGCGYYGWVGTCASIERWSGEYDSVLIGQIKQTIESSGSIELWRWDYIKGGKIQLWDINETKILKTYTDTTYNLSNLPEAYIEFRTYASPEFQADWVRVRKYISSNITFGTPTIKQF